MIELTYTITCAKCGNAHVLKYQMYNLEALIPRPSIPSDWHQVDNQILCERHTITIE